MTSLAYDCPSPSLQRWIKSTPNNSILSTEFLNVRSFSKVIRPTASVEVEVLVHYPLKHISRYLGRLPMILEHLCKLGPDGGGFEFGYDIFPENSHLDDPNDLSVFTGEVSVCKLTIRSS